VYVICVGVVDCVAVVAGSGVGCYGIDTIICVGACVVFGVVVVVIVVCVVVGVVVDYVDVVGIVEYASMYARVGICISVMHSGIDTGISVIRVAVGMGVAIAVGNAAGIG